MMDLRTFALKQFVARLGSRSILSREEEQAVLGLPGKLKQVSAHVDFVRQGQHVDHSCLVADGLVGRFGQNRDGARQITCLHIPGDMTDLPSVVSPKAGWGLSALAPTTVLQIPHIALRDIAARHNGIAEAFWRDCVADGSIFSDWVVNVGRRNAKSRVAHLMCEMAVRSAKTGYGDFSGFPLPITQNDLGDATGLTGVHINRTLNSPAMRAVIEVRAGTVTIHDWLQLVSVGDFDQAFMLLDGPAPRLEAA